jgi:hypothetical protein
LKRFLSDEGGNFAAVMALVLLPVVAMMGASVDYSGMLNRKAKIQSASDIAILAAARDSRNINEFYDLAENYLAANLPDTPFEVTPHTDPDRVNLAITSRYPTSFLGIVGFGELTIVVNSELAIEKFGRGSVGQSAMDAGTSIDQLELIRDNLLKQTDLLAPRDQEKARTKIRRRFDAMIRSASEQSASSTPIHLSK